MSVLVNTQNQQEEKVLLAFLDSLRYSYRSDIGDEVEQVNEELLDQYNKEIDRADSEIESGNYVSHEDVLKLFQDRRKAL